MITKKDSGIKFIDVDVGLSGLSSKAQAHT